eukprot:269858_1
MCILAMIDDENKWKFITENHDVDMEFQQIGGLHKMDVIESFLFNKFGFVIVVSANVTVLNEMCQLCSECGKSIEQYIKENQLVDEDDGNFYCNDCWIPFYE